MKRSAWLLLAVGFAASLVIFGFSFDNSFRQDDFEYLDHVSASRSLQELASPPPENFTFFRPGAILLFRLEYGLFGLHGGAYLAFNYLLLLASAGLLLWILLQAGLGGRAAALATALFVIGFGHYGEEVMWASTSGPLLSVVLVLLAMALALRLAKSRGAAGAPDRRPRPLAWAGVLLPLGVAPAFHESALVGPLLIWLILWLYDPRSLRARLSSFLPWCVPALAWAGTLLVLSSRYPAYQVPGSRLLRALVTLFRYPGFMLLPVHTHAPALIPAVQGLLATGVAVAGMLALWRGPRPTKLLFAWTYLALAPYALVDVSPGWLDARYLYFASLPACALAAILIERLRANRHVLVRVAAAAALVGIAVGTVALERRVEDRWDRFSRSPECRARLLLLEERRAAPRRTVDTP